ncbi:hypothetical protein BKD30_10910 [Tersicoccus phoenicis]|uniref:Uncharacterized protein n=1 Tax=Tersicoccus phoenicis TaxID=554083 RepID=A0A1R1L8L1_9MICC|nr:hypothetical protein [Tersicoccus phoenicis]OMH23867.1 hypothetical protein BKD30_10910 [Tersicoccus phoenicis]
MSLPIPLAVILIVAGLWSLVAWGFIAVRAVRATRSAPTSAPGSPSREASAPSGTSTRGTSTDEAATGPAPTPAATPSTLSLLVVAISMTLGLATLVIGFRALG